MSVGEIVIEGTLKPDGTLELDRKPNLPAGRVTVVLRPEAEVILPKDDAFWQRMQCMWASQAARGHIPRTTEEIEAERRQAADDWDERMAHLEQLQAEAEAIRKGRQSK